MAVTNRKVVMGIGNLLNRDEGLGVHAVKSLAAYLSSSECLAAGRHRLELLDGGTLGLNLLPIVEESSHLLILDAVNANQPDGTIIELPRDQISLSTGIKLSEHQVSFQEVLGLASFRGRLPGHLHLIGAQPADVSIGLDLSPTMLDVLPILVRRALRVLRAWGLLDDALLVDSGPMRVTGDD
ncbi:MAG: HyaD/HybD family hydrogenase maturation endopeptidase [Caldilineaceae bacterium]|jgi:hydrogenase maturation protease